MLVGIKSSNGLSEVNPDMRMVEGLSELSISSDSGERFFSDMFQQWRTAVPVHNGSRRTWHLTRRPLLRSGLPRSATGYAAFGFGEGSSAQCRPGLPHALDENARWMSQFAPLVAVDHPDYGGAGESLNGARISRSV